MESWDSAIYFHGGVSPTASRLIERFRGKIELRRLTIFVPALLESVEAFDLGRVRRLCGIQLSPFASDYDGEPPSLLLTDDKENLYSWYMYDDKNWYLDKRSYNFEALLVGGFVGGKKLNQSYEDGVSEPFLEWCEILMKLPPVEDAIAGIETNPEIARLSQLAVFVDISSAEYRSEFETIVVRIQPQPIGGWHRSETFGVNCFVASCIATGSEIVLMQIAKYDCELETLYQFEKETQLNVLFSQDRTRGIVISDIAMK